MIVQGATGRIVLGAAMALAPRLAGRVWAGRDADRDAVTVITRGFGVRDVALGAGLLLAVRGGGPTRRWLEAAALADVADFTGTVLAWRRLPGFGRVAIASVAGSAAVMNAILSRSADDGAALPGMR